MEGQGVEEAQKTTLVETFRGITTSTPEAALFFLESHNWHLDSAIHSFYDAADTSDDHHDALAEEAAAAAPAVIPRPSIPRPSPAPVSTHPGAAGMSSGRDKKPSGSGGRPTIRTLADLNRRSGPGSGSGSGSDSDDSDGPQEYYTGGEKSGMLVQDPSKGNHDVDAIFDQARQMGAMEGPLEHHPSSSSGSFAGTGRLLSGETVPSAPQQPENVIHNICFWTNGFTVNNGPLRRFDDPENAPFLESIRKSECPKELEPADRRSAVNVNLIRKDEKCPEPVKRHTPFHGVGRTLGDGASSGPAVPETTVTAAAPTVASSPSAGLYVDASLPSTSIQLRLADGTRMVSRFNTHHTVGDIRAFIDASRPGAARTYQLQTVGFPPKQLADLNQTIEQAGLANSVVIQKL